MANDTLLADEGIVFTEDTGLDTFTASLALMPCQARLTLTTGVPVTTADVTAAGTLYLTPYKGNKIGLYDGTNWKVHSLTEISLALTLTSGKNYDVFVYDNSGTLTLEVVVWTNDTTRATALDWQDGVPVQTSAKTKRYVGTIRASASNVTEDSAAKRFVWNYNNREPRPMRVLETTNSWDYTTATWRQANAAAANQLAFVLGWNEDAISAAAGCYTYNLLAAVRAVAIGLDATNAPATGCLIQPVGGVAHSCSPTARWDGFAGSVGYHYLAWLEISEANDTTTWYGDDGGTLAGNASGITGMMRG